MYCWSALSLSQPHIKTSTCTLTPPITHRHSYCFTNSITCYFTHTNPQTAYLWVVEAEVEVQQGESVNWTDTIIVVRLQLDMGVAIGN